MNPDLQQSPRTGASAFAPEEGERLADVRGASRDSQPDTALLPHRYLTDVVRSMARRAGAESIELEGSHVTMVSQPEPVTDLIEKALQEVGKQAGDVTAAGRSQR
jgi:hypothetical protein